MAGIYIHIPFCVSRCHYCDFYSTTLLDQTGAYVDALIVEYADRRCELTAPVQTIYIGGGTPSVLADNDIRRLLAVLPTHQAIEVTMEANPQDITPARLVAWHDAGVNRLSIGIQSFHDDMLRLMGRRHDAATARRAVADAQQAGFDNLSIDLMYGLPNETIEAVHDDIVDAIDTHVPHISTYCLSYEQHTPFTRHLEAGDWPESDDDELNDQYDMISACLSGHGYEHYEISNFARPGFRSRHNAAYWTKQPYLGLGAAAHSFDGHACRRWNSSDVHAYIRGTMNHLTPFDSETLTLDQCLIEDIMLGLRTSEGIPADLIVNPKSRDKVTDYIHRGLLQSHQGRLIATQQGLHIINRIIENVI